MSMPTFPILTAVPEVSGFQHKAAIDPVHRVRFMSGAVLTRTLFTVIPVDYHIRYLVADNVDKLILETWEKNEIRYGGITFEWENIKSEKTYETKLLKPIRYKLHPRASDSVWTVDFDIRTLVEI